MKILSSVLDILLSDVKHCTLERLSNIKKMKKTVIIYRSLYYMHPKRNNRAGEGFKIQGL